MKRKALGFALLLAPMLLVALWPQSRVGAQASAGFTLLATVNSPTTLTYLDGTCPKLVTCTYQVTAFNSTGESPAALIQGSTTVNVATVVNSGANGRITLNWIAGTVDTNGDNAPTGYRVYTGNRSPNPPSGLAAVSN